MRDFYKAIFRWVDFLLTLNTGLVRISLALFYKPACPCTRQIFNLHLEFGRWNRKRSVYIRLAHPDSRITMGNYRPVLEAGVSRGRRHWRIDTRNWEAEAKQLHEALREEEADERTTG